ncbi:nuclear factor erythroid 2-related factor 1-like [Sinocyclocheilus anshuiensis]|uniref:Nuclear factor erythroid 2-related factor 1-like n=1 Tax=Sinocyclocheilus anshuiensis TaxID=1608454 RepID=A0A671P566_9TELE|nr:PREDICTED: nuclear factor erythroid 2-related factor 1-like [Sinocyclocheilus anshuiensis]
MHHMKKYFTEGLIQFTILLSLIGVRVDVDTYLSGYFSPLIETDGGPSSAFIQTPFHHYRDTAAGHQVHPKCPELDYFFTSRRLLNEVRTLGTPARFPTRVSAWLVHLVPDDGSDAGEPHDLSGDPGDEEINGENHREEDEHRAGEGFGLSVSQDLTVSRPCCAAGELSKEETLLDQVNEEEEVKEERGQEETSPTTTLNQLTQSSALEQEDLLGSSTLPPPLSGLELPPRWHDFLSEFDDFDSMVPQRISDLEAELPNPISYDVSLQDAMVTGGDSANRRLASSQTPLFRLESTNSSHSDPSQSSAGALPSSLFSLSGNSSRNETSPSQMGGYLDEAVFDHINMLDLDNLGTMDPQMLDGMQGDMDTPWPEDSDSGLSLESSSRSPTSPSTSSDSFCEDEGGATGYSSEVESLSSKGGACAAAYRDWSPVNLVENIWHDHTYSTPQAQNSTPSSWFTAIKQEVMSDDEGEPEEMSRDEHRVQALGLPFSAFQIVNMPVENFLELLDSQNLSGSQVTLLRDVRRRGKNKLAAQNCRKRKLDAILTLQGEVEGLSVQRDALLRQRSHTAKALSAAAERFETLSRTLLSQLRDEYGHPLNPEHYTLHCSANGRVMVQPRTNTTSRTMTSSKTVKRKKDKKP